MRDEMPLTRALSLCCLLVEFELESPAIQPAPPGWQHELKLVQRTLKAELARNRSPCGEFFTSPDDRRRRKVSNGDLAE